MRRIDLVALAVLSLFAGDLVSQTEWQEGRLSRRKIKDRSWSLPASEFRAVRKQITLKTIPGQSFRCERDGKALRVDTNGDGDLKSVGSGAVLVGFKDRKRVKHPIEVRWTPQGWEYASAEALAGKLGRHSVLLIDGNANGTYSDVGQDVILARGESVAPLSSVVSVRGELYELRVDDAEMRLRYRKYRGDTGLISLARDGGVPSKWRVEFAIIHDVAAKKFFDLGADQGPVNVPVGSYRIGFIRLSHRNGKGVPEFDHTTRRQTWRPERVDVSGAKTEPVLLEVGETATLAWGGACTLTSFQVHDGVIRPQDLEVTGQRGETYRGLAWFRRPVVRATDPSGRSVGKIEFST